MDWKERKRALSLLGEEEGTIVKDPGGRVSICLVFPSSYHVGMSNLGFQAVYAHLNSFDHLLCERAFLSLDPREGFSGEEPVRSLESGRRLDEFDLVGFSVSFENDYLSIPLILSRSGIEPLRERRGEKDPVVFCGGFAPTLNPEPLAEIVDFVVLGDGEPPLTDAADLLRSRWGSKEEFLGALSRVEGVYVPSLSEPVFLGDSGGREGTGPKPAVADVNRYPARTVVFTRRTEFGDMFLVEIARGCPKRCFFCGVGHRPAGFRALSREVLFPLVEEGLSVRKKVGLVGSAVLDHPDFLDLARFVLSRGGAVSPASIRADRVTGEVAQVLADSGLRTATLAPESGDEARRKRLGKGIPDEAFFEAAFLLHERGVGTVKLYFVAGLPGTEEDEEVEGITEFVKKLLHSVRSRGKKRTVPGIVVSISGFVPKAHTPFQFAPFPGVERLKRVFSRVKRELGRIKVKCETEVPRYAYLQALLSLGDRKVSKILAENPGRAFLPAVRTSPVNPDFYALREKGKEEGFPWDPFSLPGERDALWRAFRRYAGWSE